MKRLLIASTLVAAVATVVYVLTSRRPVSPAADAGAGGRDRAGSHRRVPAPGAAVGATLYSAIEGAAGDLGAAPVSERGDPDTSS